MFLYRRPESIYRDLSQDPQISHRLGEFVLPNGEVYPAISLVPPFPDKKSLKVSGVSVTVHDDPKSFGVLPDGGGANRYYLIEISCHGGESVADYRAIVTRIMQRYPTKVRCFTINGSDESSLPRLAKTEIYVYQLV
jgi:hypothetical protein